MANTCMAGQVRLYLWALMRASPSGKASAFQADIRRFESGRPLLERMKDEGGRMKFILYPSSFIL